MRPHPVLNDDQWRVFSALNRLGRPSTIVAMPGTRLEHWFRNAFDGLLDASLVDDPTLKKLARGVAGQFHRATIPLALVKIEGNNKHLGLAVTDEDLVTRWLANRGVATITWTEALDYLRRDQARSLVDIAETVVACGRAPAPAGIHTEEARLKRTLAQHLFLAWPDELDAAQLDRETVASLKAEFEKRRSELSIFRDVAVSRMISVLPGDQVDPDMRRVFHTSDVDFVIHGRAPHNMPLLAIEYDGREHRTNQDKMATDKAKDRLFAAAGIALMRIGTDRAAAPRPNQAFEERHQRLIPMLEIARALLERTVTLRARADEDLRQRLRDVQEIGTIAKALYGKEMAGLGAAEKVNALSIQQLARMEECSLTDAERAAEDQDDEASHTLDSQLAAFGVDPGCVSNFSIHATLHGHVGKARLQLNDGSAVRSIETVAVSVSAPFLPQETIDQLVNMQIHAELAYSVFKLTSSARGIPPEHSQAARHQ